MTGSNPKVSVVIPVYNGEEYVADAINSVFEQTYRNIELIAVNDGSQDNSLQVLRGFGNEITIVEQHNQGVARARNAGIERSTGDFIAFLDQDDWWLPQKTEQQVLIFKASNEIGLVHTAVKHVDGKTGKLLPPLDPSANPMEIQGSCFKKLLMGNPVYNSSVMVSRSAIENVGYCNPALAGNTVADYELWLRIAKRFQLGFVETPETCYRMHEKQGIWDRRAMLAAELGVLLHLREDREWHSTPEFRKRISNLYDALAVAFYDRGDFDQARQYFKKAFTTQKTFRNGLRWTVSHIPPKLTHVLQSCKAKFRQRFS